MKKYGVYYKTKNDCATFISFHKSFNMAMRKLASINNGKLKPNGLQNAWIEDKQSKNCDKYFKGDVLK